MSILTKENINFLRDFIGISHWESLISILLFFTIIISFWIIIKKTKLKFHYRIFIGMGLGLLFGITLQAIMKFPQNSLIDPKIKTVDNPDYHEWVLETSNWITLFKSIFIMGITMLTVPIVFLALARITAKKSDRNINLARITIKGMTLLLLNVAIAFSITFILGIAFKIGVGWEDITKGTVRDGEVVKNIPKIITNYVPSSFLGVLTGMAIIPVIILGALVGSAIKKMTKYHPDQMDSARKFIDTSWNIIISILMFFVKLMPFAVTAMLTTAIIDRPIGYLVKIGIIIGVAYLSLFLAFLWHLISLALFGIKPWQWLKKLKQPLISAFATQSSNAVLPLALKELKDNFKVKEEATSTIMPLSTTMGLTGCAGVQAGIIVAFLYYAVIVPDPNLKISLPVIFILGLIITLIVSLGVAGVPGTAAVVTSGLLGGLGFGAFYSSIYGVIGALDGLFDMGRTTLNISGGMQAATIVAKSENMIDDQNLIRKKYFFQPIGKLITKIKTRKMKKNLKNKTK